MTTCLNLFCDTNGEKMSVTTAEPAAGGVGAGATLELRSVTCERGGRVLFSNLGCRVAAGQLLRVLGANGSGKTSLLRLLCGLLPPALGEVRWGGQPVAVMKEEFGRQLVYLGHAAALKDDLTAAENLQVACRLGGIAVTPLQVGAALQQAGLGVRGRAAVRLLSQGQRRRVALARLVLAQHVPLWVLDEPFNALDTVATDWLRSLITGHLAQGGMVVLTSHQEVGLEHLGNQQTLLL